MTDNPLAIIWKMILKLHWLPSSVEFKTKMEEMKFVAIRNSTGGVVQDSSLGGGRYF